MNREIKDGKLTPHYTMSFQSYAPNLNISAYVILEKSFISSPGAKEERKNKKSIDARNLELVV